MGTENRNEMDWALLEAIITLCRQNYADEVTERLLYCINLVTLDFVYRASPRDKNRGSWTKHRSLNYIFIDEFSQASNDDLFRVFNNITYFNHPYENGQES